eukprot:5512508-Prymnesium_polylepis.1
MVRPPQDVACAHLVVGGQDSAIRLGVAVGRLRARLGATGLVRRRDVLHREEAKLAELAGLGGGRLRHRGARKHGTRTREQLAPAQRRQAPSQQQSTQCIITRALPRVRPP